MNTSVSILTPTFNSAVLLPRLVESLLCQTDQDFEWVVQDGGSDDNTLSILYEAQSSMRNLKINSCKDFGIYDALNKALRASSGVYYLVVGSDDTLIHIR